MIGGFIALCGVLGLAGWLLKWVHHNLGIVAMLFVVVKLGLGVMAIGYGVLRYYE
jgi:Flp pilus assembly protein TadB